MSVSHLKAQIRQHRSKVSSYENHINKVEKIINKIDSDFDNNVYVINSDISLCIELVSSGLHGCEHLSTISNDIDYSKEKSTALDLDISECRLNLRNEVYRCQQNIDVLEAEIRQIESEIETARATESSTIFF